MRTNPVLRTCLVALGCAGLLQACGGAGSGPSGTYAAVGGEPMTIEFKSGGKVVMAAAGIGESQGTYVADGEKLIVSIDNQKHTFILDGNCVEEQRGLFGKFCKGGKAGEAGNVSTRSVPTAPAGTWVATNADGEFRITFQPGNVLTMQMKPTTGNPETVQGTFTIEGDKLYATVGQGNAMVLTFVNNTYESSSFGLPMKFVKQ